jgi:hypothetical protein
LAAGAATLEGVFFFTLWVFFTCFLVLLALAVVGAALVVLGVAGALGCLGRKCQRQAGNGLPDR